MITSLLLVLSLSAQERVEYYYVAGGSAPQLRAELNRLRPADADGRRHDARTRWGVHWRFTTRRSVTGCEVASFVVTFESVTTLPRWTNERDGTPALVAQWRAYEAALTQHEEGHKRIGQLAAQAVRDAGAGVPPQTVCAQLGPIVNSRANAVLEEYRRKDRQYDAETNHGMKQGARFP